MSLSVGRWIRAQDLIMWGYDYNLMINLLDKIGTSSDLLSVTIVGEISPLCQNFKNLCQMVWWVSECLAKFWAYFEKVYVLGQLLNVQILKINIAIWSHWICAMQTLWLLQI